MTIDRKKAARKSTGSASRIPFPFLPKGFESTKRTLVDRKRIARALAQDANLALPTHCRFGKRCNSGSCQRCVRWFRYRLLKFCFREGFHNKPWVFVTIRPRKWEVAIGDHRSFLDQHGPVARYRDLKECKGILQVLRREFKSAEKRCPGSDQLIAIGSMETIWEVLDNKPKTKPFHIHLMVHGLKATAIKKALDRYLTDNGLRRNKEPYLNVLLVEKIKPTQEDVIRTMSYAYKLPFWRYSRSSDSPHQLWKQWPSREQILELDSNYGVRECQDRLLTIGAEYRARKFRLLPVKSSLEHSEGQMLKKDVGNIQKCRRKRKESQWVSGGGLTLGSPP